jgi:hypothetical protein
MADTIVEIPGVGQVSFPDSMTAEEISAAAKRLHDEANAPQPEPKSVSGFIGNILPSAGQLVTDSIKGLVTLPTAAYESESKRSTLKDDPVRASMQSLPLGAFATDAIRGVVQHYKDRYGSVDSALDTLYEDPAGAAADVLPLGKPLQAIGAAGKARLVGKAAGWRTVAPGVRVRPNVPSTGSQIASAAERVGRAIDAPVQAAADAVSAGAVKVADASQRAGNWIYRGGLKEGETQRQIAERVAQAAGKPPVYTKQPIEQPEAIGIKYNVSPTMRSIGNRQGQLKNQIEELSGRSRAPLFAIAEGVNEGAVADAAKIRSARQQLEALQTLEKVIPDAAGSRLGPIELMAGALGFASDSLMTGGLTSGGIALARTPTGRMVSGVGLDRFGKIIKRAAPASDDALRAALLARLLEHEEE